VASIEIKQGMKRFFKTGALLCMALLAVLLAACSNGSTGSTTTSPQSNVLTVGVSPKGPFSEDFNPFLSNGSTNLYGTQGLLYEPLYFWDQLNANSTQPLLAKSYDLSSDGLHVTFHLQTGVKWSDGQPFTSADVAFTINYSIQYASKGLDPNGLSSFVKDVTTPDANTVTVDFKSPSSTNLWYLAGQTYIVPQHIWSSITDPATETVNNPVGTGPYVLDSFSAQDYKFKKNPTYWGGAPKVDEISFPAFDSNTSAATFLATSGLDWTGLFIADIKDVYVNRDPAHNSYWFPGVQTTMLLLNLSEPKFQDLKVRQAISAAIDRGQLNTVAEDGYQTVASPTGLTPGFLKDFLDPSYSSVFGAADPTSASSILSGDGYTKDANGYFAKGGQELSFSVMAPNGWSDWNSMETLLQTQLKAAGIKVSVLEPSSTDWSTKVADGNFDATLHWTNHGPNPYYMYNALLASSNSAAIGSAANSNYQRWDDKTTDGLLSTIADTTDVNVQKQAFNSLEGIMVNQVPAIPLVEGSDWNEFTTARFTGWPSASNPYALPAPFDAPDIEITVLHLTPVA
jgi:peptide/nickel transport system substrate-binding protein